MRGATVRLLTGNLFALSLLAISESSPVHGQEYESITERAAVAVALERARNAEEAAFDAAMGNWPGGDRIIAFISSPSPANAPSLALMKAAAAELQRQNVAGFEGRNALSNILTQGSAGAAGGGALPTSALAVQAAAEFLAGRVKDELAIEYVDKLEELVDRPIVSDITFHSQQALALVRSTNYRLVLPLLRESVVRDFRALPDRLTADSTYEGAPIRPSDDVLTSAALAVHLVEGVLESRPTLDMLAELRFLRDYVGGNAITKDSLVLADETARNAFIVTGIVANEFNLQAKGMTALVSAAPGAKFFAIFLAHEILSDRYPGLTGKATLANALVGGAGRLHRVSAAWEEMDRLLAHLKTEVAPDALAGGYLALIPRMTAAVVAHSQLAGLQSPQMLRALRFMDHAGAAYGAWLDGRYVGVATATVAFADELNPGILTSDVRNFLLFAANFADAETSEEMTAVLEAAALPPAGYRTKRQTAAVGISAYGGGAVFAERLDGGSTTGAGGLSFPIGAEFSFPWRPSWGPLRPWSSLSIFVSMVDVGNFVNFRASDGPPQPSLDQALAPGIGLQFGAGRENPWSYGFLFQRVSDLRDDAQRDVSRVGFFLGIDMPLFRVWSR